MGFFESIKSSFGQTKSATQKQESQQSLVRSKPKEWHEVLGVLRSCSYDEVRKAYREKISRYHPDRMSAQTETVQKVCQKKTIELNSAYNQAKRHFRHVNEIVEAQSKIKDSQED